MPQPDITVIVPVYNRGPMIAYTLESVCRASSGIGVELIIVDDGSESPVEPIVRELRLPLPPVRFIRQENRGLLFARLAGLPFATGRYLVFLDSDDLVSPEKFRLQIEAMDRSGAEVSYTDSAHTTLEGAYEGLVMRADAPSRTCSEAGDFFIDVQPAPHSPVFRSSYVSDLVNRAYFPPSSLYNPVAEIWFYHNAAPRPARVVHVPGPHTIVGCHGGGRLTNHWERLGIASLAVMEAFARTVPAAEDRTGSRGLVGAKAFQSWRRLPHGFYSDFEARLLGVWRTLSGGRLDGSALGGSGFRLLSRMLGPVASARLLRRLRGASYADIRTISREDYEARMRALPPP